MPALSLHALSLKASTALIAEYLQKIDKRFFTPPSLESPLTTECTLSIRKLQDYLRSYVTPSLWGNMLRRSIVHHNDKEENRYRDIRILYSTFVFDDVYLQEFKLPACLPGSEAVCKSYETFWLQHIPMMTYLTHVDVTEVNCDAIVRKFAVACAKLKSVSLPRAVSCDTAEFVIRTCSDLRMLVGDLSCTRQDAERLTQLALEQLENLVYVNLNCNITGEMLSKVNHKLKLKRMCLKLNNLEDIDVALDLCPDLQHLLLRLTGPHNDVGTRSSGIFEKLAASHLKLSSLSLTNFHIESEAFALFLFRKAVYLTDFVISSSRMNATVTVVLELLSKCKNLKHMILDDVFGLSREDTSPHPLYHNISLPVLRSLSVIIRRRGPPELLHLAKYWLEHTTILVQASVLVEKRDEVGEDDVVAEILDIVNSILRVLQDRARVVTVN